jgi:hypothetical protein
MRYAPVLLSMLLGATPPALAQLSINFGAPGVSIGLSLPVYPRLARIPGYPVYYAPEVDSNYFFYDGMYWVYDGDDWYASSWYNGPWTLIDRLAVPLYLLRVPVRYYRHAPSYFRGWRADAPPRWNEHWGRSWEERRSGWDRWNRRAAPAPAPLPTYQRQYSGERYPQRSQQAEINTRNYRYQPRDQVPRQYRQYERSQVQPPQARQAPPRQGQGKAQEPGKARDRNAPEKPLGSHGRSDSPG